MQCVDAGVAGLWVFAVLGQVGPFASEQLEIAVDVLLELADGFGAEGVGDDLALASMFGSVTGVEETSSDRDEGVIVVTEIELESCCKKWTLELGLPLQKSIAMSIDGLNGIDVGDGDMIGLDPHHLAKLLVQFIDLEVSSASSSLI